MLFPKGLKVNFAVLLNFQVPNSDKPKPKSFKREGRKVHEVIQIKT